MVTIKSNISETRFDDILSLVRCVTLKTQSLTPRSKDEIITALKTQNLALAFDGNIVVGWLIATPYNLVTQELGMAYILPAYRGTGIFNRLISELIGRRPVSIVITYEARLKSSLIKNWGFKVSSLGEFIRLSNGRFLLSRLRSSNSIGAVISHTTKNNPLYLVRKTRE